MNMDFIRFEVIFTLSVILLIVVGYGFMIFAEHRLRNTKRNLDFSQGCTYLEKEIKKAEKRGTKINLYRVMNILGSGWSHVELDDEITFIDPSSFGYSMTSSLKHFEM